MFGYIKKSFYIFIYIFFLLGALVNADILPAVYDAAVAGDDYIAAPDRPICINVYTNSLLTISPNFFGINIHPVPASWAFRNKELVANLKPDVIRIMATHRTYWLRDSNNKSITIRSSLSPKEGVYDYTELDALINSIISIGAKPYVTIGFGAPAWLDTNKANRLHKVPPENIIKYAQYMAAVVKHMNAEKELVRWVTIDNEPENLQYSIDDYITLVKTAAKLIRNVDPMVKICGPVTGYATWLQPDGSELSFSRSLSILKKANLPFDVIDWHIYSTNPELIFKCVDIVKNTWPGKPMVISELNRDWRYGNDTGGETSKYRNTCWDSVAWLAYCYDELQKSGVSQVHYFCLGNDYFGLYDYHQTKVNPNYFLFAIMTNIMGRERLGAVSDNKAIGVIATVKNKKKIVLVYNRANADVDINFDLNTDKKVLLWDYNKEWYRNNRKIDNGSISLISPKSVSGTNKVWKISERGILVFKY